MCTHKAYLYLCIFHRPCLLVGASASGKSMILKTLADACNIHIETLAMSTSTDVTELIGCFEQTDALGEAKDILKVVRRVYDGACIVYNASSDALQTITKHYWSMNNELLSLKEDDPSFVNNESVLVAMKGLVSGYETLAKVNASFSREFSEEIAATRKFLFSLKKKASPAKAHSPFKWVDGTLVQAMERGYWLHLENVNFCPSSVLDRLNPLMEFGGELVMTECGITDEDQNAKSRVISPHPNFRLFLSMNPNSHGEVSRAMRNRCIEVCVLPPSFTSLEEGDSVQIDALTGLWDSGVRSHDVATYMVNTHKSDCQKSVDLHLEDSTVKALKGWGDLFNSLLKRGMSITSLPMSYQLLYEIHERDCTSEPLGLTQLPFGLITSISSRKDLVFNPSWADVSRCGRLLKIVNNVANNSHLSVVANFTSLAPLSQQIELKTERLRLQAICHLLETIPLNELKHLSSFLDGFCSESATQLKFAVEMTKHVVFGRSRQLYIDTSNSLIELVDDRDERDTLNASQIVRLPHLLEEQVVYYNLDSSSELPSLSKMNVISLSYCIHRKHVDASSVMCPVTPLLYPLFQMIDTFISSWQLDTEDFDREVSMKRFTTCRDKFWQCLKRTQYLGGSSKSQVGFIFTGFLVQYCWLKKAFGKCMNRVERAPNNQSTFALRRLALSFDTIDDTIQECAGGSISSSNILWKKGGHPILPSRTAQFEGLSNIRDVANLIALTKEELFGFVRIVSSSLAAQVDLRKLVKDNHPCLFVENNFHSDVLGALSTMFWAATDEIKESSSKHPLIGAPVAIRNAFKDQEDAFVTNLQLATIDTTIKTVDNALDLDAIKELAVGGSQDSDAFVQGLLLRFGGIQASQIGEVWCISEEAGIISRVAAVLRQANTTKLPDVFEELRRHRHDIKSFINNCIKHTQWSVSDLRPYQTLVWALESDSTDGDILRLAGFIWPRMLFSFSNHQWVNLFNDMDVINSHLQGPSLWSKEDLDMPPSVDSSPFGLSVKSTMIANCSGPSRTQLNVQRAAIFRLLRLPSHGVNSPFYTMENGEARQSQGSKLLSLFANSSYSGDDSPVDVIKYQLGTVLKAFSETEGGDCADMTAILDQSPHKTADLVILFKQQHTSLRCHVSTLLIPLVERIQLLNVSEKGSLPWKQHVAHAWVYIGLLRLHLLVPSSPIDPGRKPAAKVEELDHFIEELQSNIHSYSLHFGLSCGDFNPDLPTTRLLVAQAELSSKKRTSQEKKIIERPPNSPPFHDLFREIHHFCKTVSSTSNVLALVDLIDRHDSESSYRSQELNWQCSAASFCSRLSTVYAMYEDVTIPCINEIRSIQRGLRELTVNQTESAQAQAIVQTQNILLMYPIATEISSKLLTNDCYDTTMTDVLLRFGNSERNNGKQEMELTHRSYQLATLVRLQLQSQTMLSDTDGVHGKVRDEANSIFSSLAHSSVLDINQKKERTGTASTTENDREEKEFREYFPNHGAEFERIVTSIEEADDLEISDEEDAADDNATLGYSKLQDDELALVVALHREMFTGRRSKIDDNLRLRAFITSYEAASRLSHLTEWLRKSQNDDASSLASHVLALALRCSVRRRAWSPFLSSDSDFHNDPLPSESIRADLPLRNLSLRVGQLLRAFPGHSVLVALGQIVERIRQLDIQVVSLGKVMSGLEVILRKAQDWEQHASQRVQLGAPLKEISTIVASWRKLELQSWSNLLTMREKRRGIRATQHWPRMYGLVHNIGERGGDDSTKVKRRANVAYSPSWVWKGFPAMTTKLSVDGDTKSMADFAKVLDTFLLTANLAEFSDRLALVENFVHEITNEIQSNGTRRLPLARLLQSFWNYYNRLAPLLLQRKNQLREPIEKRLKDEVKLAKWDEQSYYALVRDMRCLLMAFPVIDLSLNIYSLSVS